MGALRRYRQLPDAVLAEMRASPVIWSASDETKLLAQLDSGLSIAQLVNHVRRVGKIHYMLRVRRDPIAAEARA